MVGAQVSIDSFLEQIFHIMIVLTIGRRRSDNVKDALTFVMFCRKHTRIVRRRIKYVVMCRPTNRTWMF